MEITSKFVYIKKKSTFESLKETIPKNLNPIVFIEDSKEIWTCGTYFNIGYPTLTVKENNSTVDIYIGEEKLNLSTSGESLSIRKGTGNNVIISSNALTQISTNDPLEWTNQRQLLHKESGVKEGTYGPTSNSSSVSIIQVPSISVNPTGHIIDVSNKNLQIRDYVQQNQPLDQNSERPILISYSANKNDETAPVIKAGGLSYNEASGTLAVKGGVIAGGPSTITGDLTVESGYIIGKVKGDVEGQAVPKVHAALSGEYGGASTKLYGHVILADEFTGIKPEPSSSNEDPTKTDTVAIAASPLMVWNAVQEAKSYTDAQGIVVTALDEQQVQQDLSKKLNFSDDFNTVDNTIYLNWEEL